MMDLLNLLDSYKGRRLVFVSGNFNIIHPGHLRLLRFARSCGDVLLIGLFTDGAGGTLVRFESRRESLLALKFVSDVIPVDPANLLNFLASLKPHIVVKGKEHEGSSEAEQELVSSYGGHLLFASGDQAFSSRDLIREEVINSECLYLRPPTAFLTKHKFSKEALIKRINAFKDLRVLVIGDLIVDEYIQCDAIGMSQEDPTLVVTPVEIETFVGAAGFVAMTLASLGASVNFISIVGQDTKSKESETRLIESSVMPHFVFDESRPTTTKQRFRAQGKTLLRVSHVRTHDAAQAHCEKALRIIYSLVEATDLVLFSDFNYGCLPQSFVDRVISLCLKNGLAYIADSQASSQISDVSRYRGACLLTATEREARLAVNDFKSGIQNVANTLIQKASAEQLFVKLGAEGLIALRSDGLSIVTDTLPALNSNPIDVVGAGDALLSAASLTLRSGGSAIEAAYIGSIAAAVQVSRIGNRPITRVDLLNAIEVI